MDILMPLYILQAKKLSALEKMICSIILMKQNACKLTNEEISEIIYTTKNSTQKTLERMKKRHIIFADGHKFDRTLSVINENIA